MDAFLLGILWPGVERPNHRVYISKQLAKVNLSTYFHTNHYESSVTPHFSQHPGFSIFLNLVVLMDGLQHIVVLICISLQNNNFENDFLFTGHAAILFEKGAKFSPVFLLGCLFSY